jgi:Sec-independent protein translocase protein TatA
MPDFLLVLIAILLIVLLVRGPRALPEIGTGLGQMIRGFRDTLREPPAAPTDQAAPAATDAPAAPTDQRPSRDPADRPTSDPEH